MTNVRELLVRSQDTTTEPDCIPLYHILTHVHLDWRSLCSNNCLISLNPSIHTLLHQFIEAFVEIIEERAAT